MLVIDHVSKQFGSRKALDDIHLEIEDGCFFGLLGSNGAGKTTLMRIITTLLLPSEGKILLDGQPVTRTNAALKRKITMVTQEYSLRSDMTIEEILKYQGLLYRIPKKERQAESERLLRFCGLWEHRKKKVRALSGGMKRKLMLCRALLPKPKIVLLDEPTVGMDPFYRRQSWELIRELNKSGITFLLTTHYMDEAQALCDKIALIDGGKILQTDTYANLIAEVGSFTVDYFDGNQQRSRQFLTKEDALDFAQTQTAQFTIRETNLEDIFIAKLGRNPVNTNGDSNSIMGKMG